MDNLSNPVNLYLDLLPLLVSLSIHSEDLKLYHADFFMITFIPDQA